MKWKVNADGSVDLPPFRRLQEGAAPPPSPPTAEAQDAHADELGMTPAEFRQDVLQGIQYDRQQKKQNKWKGRRSTKESRQAALDRLVPKEGQGTRDTLWLHGLLLTALMTGPVAPSAPNSTPSLPRPKPSSEPAEEPVGPAYKGTLPLNHWTMVYTLNKKRGDTANRKCHATYTFWDPVDGEGRTLFDAALAARKVPEHLRLPEVVEAERVLRKLDDLPRPEAKQHAHTSAPLPVHLQQAPCYLVLPLPKGQQVPAEDVVDDKFYVQGVPASGSGQMRNRKTLKEQRVQKKHKMKVDPADESGGEDENEPRDENESSDEHEEA
ncbi:hypothetical protein ACM66B_002927 [Microbotryomycetes sp. NB124-2]